jgi:hypothetical protein
MEFSPSEYDENRVDEPVHSFMQEVRDLFGISLIADLEPSEHTDECEECRAHGQEHRCVCPTVPTYYLGRRAEPSLGLPNVFVTPGFPSIAELETFCEQRIYKFRAKAKSEGQRQN